MSWEAKWVDNTENLQKKMSVFLLNLYKPWFVLCPPLQLPHVFILMCWSWLLTWKARVFFSQLLFIISMVRPRLTFCLRCFLSKSNYSSRTFVTKSRPQQPCDYFDFNVESTTLWKCSKLEWQGCVPRRRFEALQEIP